jgi:hypothetical protein
MSENDPPIPAILQDPAMRDFLKGLTPTDIRQMLEDSAEKGITKGLRPYAGLTIGGKPLLGTPQEQAKEVQGRLDALAKHECYYKPTPQKGLWAAAGLVMGAGGMYLATQQGWIGKGAEAPGTGQVDSYGNVVNL